MKKYLLLLFSLISFASCVEDEGNYDYKESRNLTTVGIEQFYKLTVGESQVLTPKIIERYDKNEKEIEGAKIEWFINDEFVTEGPSYTFVAEKNGKYQFNLKIEDPKTKSISTNTFDIRVQSAYIQGFVILSELEGKSALSFLRTKWFNRPDTVVYTDDYLRVFEKHNNQESLLKEPIMITENLKNEYTDLCGEIGVLTREGNNYSLQYLNGESLARETHVQQEFEGEELPANWHPKQMLHTIWDSFVLNEDGKVYIRREGSGEAFHTGVFSKDITLWNNNKFERLFFSDYARTDALMAIEVTPEGKRQYVGIRNKVWSADYNLGRIDISGDYTDEFTNLKDEILFADWRRGDYDENGLSVAQKTPADEYVLHCFNTGYVGNRSKTIPVEYSIKINLTKEIGITNVTGLCTSKAKNFTYIADDHSLYAVNNYKEHETWNKMHTFDKKIVSICDQSTFMSYSDYKVALAIGFEDGSIEVWEINDEMPNIFNKKVYTSKNTFGKIKQILYKCGRPGNYLN